MNFYNFRFKQITRPLFVILETQFQLEDGTESRQICNLTYEFDTIFSLTTQVYDILVFYISMNYCDAEIIKLLSKNWIEC